MTAPLHARGYVDDHALYGDLYGIAMEQVPELTWPMSVATYSQMATDPQLASVLKAYRLPVVRSDWGINGAGCRPRVVQEVADDLGLPIRGVDPAPTGARVRGVRWHEHLRAGLLNLTYGHMCVDSETEALTGRGWKRGHEIEPDDLLYTVNPSTGAAEWQPLERMHVYPGAHVVRELDGRSHSSVTTLDHRWITRAHSTGKLRFRTTEALNANDRILRAAPPAALPMEAKYSDAFVELVAWYWTEGQEHPGGGAQVWQSETVNPQKAARIRAALTVLFGPARRALNHGHGPALHGWRETTRTGGVSLGRVTEFYLDISAASELRSIAPRKVVSPAFLRELTVAQLRLFLETSIDADGCRSGGRRMMAQKDGQRLDSFEMACTLLGLPWTRSPFADGYQTWVGSQTEIRPVAAARRTDGRMTDVVRTVDDGVWCPQVANRTWLARRRGTVWFTGNCFELEATVADRARLTGLYERMPSTLTEIKAERNGALESVTQAFSADNRQPVPIPADRLQWYVNDRVGAAWQGNSLLRPAYGPWLLKREMWRVLGVSSQRFGTGVPNLEPKAGTTPTSTQIEAAQRMASAARVGNRAGMVPPPGFEFKLTGLTGSVPDTLGFVKYLDQQMTRMALAGVVDLGDTPNGSRALGETFVDLLLLALQEVGDGIADAATTQTVARLVAWNWGEDEPVPAVVCGDVGARHEVTADALAALIGAGALSWDPGLEEYVRRVWKLPARDPDAPPMPPPALRVAARARARAR